MPKGARGEAAPRLLRSRPGTVGRGTRAGRLLLLLLFLSTTPAAAPASMAQGQNPFRGRRLYVEPNTQAARQAAQWRRARPQDAARLQRIAEQPQAIWLGDWMRNVRGEVDQMTTRITRAGALPVYVAYNIPHRDCGLYSAGGARGGDAYRRWIQDLAQGLRRRPSVVILEPDALPSMECLPLRLQDERFVLMREAVRTLKAAGAAVYIDAGNGNWKPANEMAPRLIKAGIELADGFSLNISNFHGTQVNIAYGEQLSRLVGGKHFVIDTSRNGRNAPIEKEWCNARNQALGRPPTTQTGHPLVDAFLWVKTPGQSDGTCNGGPRAGEWWTDYALELSRMAEVLGSMLPR